MSPTWLYDITYFYSHFNEICGEYSHTVNLLLANIGRVTMTVYQSNKKVYNNLSNRDYHKVH